MQTNYMAQYLRHSGIEPPESVPADSIVDWLPDDRTSIGCITSLDVWEISRLEIGQKYKDISAFVWERIA